MKRPYKVVDVFTNRPLLGNPVAVVLNAEGLDDQAMQRLARWTNLSETTFVLPTTQSKADYRLRIFTPQGEVPLAGHPTLGSAHAVLEAGIAAPRAEVLVQECAVGLIEIQVRRCQMTTRLMLSFPTAEISPLSTEATSKLEGSLGVKLTSTVPPARVNVGVTWVVAQVQSLEALLLLRPDFSHLAEFERWLGVAGTSLYASYPAGSTSDVEVRSFLPSNGVIEDPVCGSGNAAIAAHRLVAERSFGASRQYIASQGQCVGRTGCIFVEEGARGQIRIGGECLTCIDGYVQSN